MDTMEQSQAEGDVFLQRRRMSRATLLSLFGAGIGHLYAGRGRRGAILMALSLSHAPLLYLLSLLPPSDVVLYAVGGILLLTVGVGLFALVDAARVARAAPDPYRSHPYNNVALYVALIVLCLMWVVMGTAFVKDRAFEVYSIPTESMAPTIASGDHVLVNKNNPAAFVRGDVVIFRAPGTVGRFLIKRIIGLPGEHVRVRGDGVVAVDDQSLVSDESVLRDGESAFFTESAGPHTYRVTRAVGKQSFEAEIPEGYVYLLGDNRANSRDSRSFGPVEVGDVLGVAQYLFTRRDGGRQMRQFP